MQRRWVQMTPEQKVLRAAAARVSMRRWWAHLISEQKVHLTSKQKAQRREAVRERMRQWWAYLTPEEMAQQVECMRQGHMCQERVLLTPEAKAKRREYDRQRRAKMTPEAKAKRREYDRQRRAKMTPEDLEMNEVSIWSVQNCPILEQTGDGRPCGRCGFFLPDGKTCPRHGDVEIEVKQYAETGHGTIENEMRRRKGLPLLGGKLG